MNPAQLRALVIACAGRICAQRGWDVDELVQDVAVEVLSKSETPSRWDPTRSAWSTYVTRLTRSVIGDRLSRARLEARGWDELYAQEQEPPSVDAPDSIGLDDEQAQRLDAVRVDAARVLNHVAFSAVMAWMLHGREVAGLAIMSGVDELTLWRYLALQLGRLRRGAAPEWVHLWGRHRAYAVRRLRVARREQEKGSAGRYRAGTRCA